MADSSGSVFLFEGIKRGLCRIADYSAILQQPHFVRFGELCKKDKKLWQEMGITSYNLFI